MYVFVYYTGMYNTFYRYIIKVVTIAVETMIKNMILFH